MLSGLGLMLIRSAQKRNEGNVNKQAVFSADLQGDLTNSFQKRLRLNISDRAADFGDYHVGVGLFAYAVNKLLDLVCDVRNDLHGRAKIFTSALLVQHVPIDLTGS